jgi:hypothetical protein
MIKINIVSIICIIIVIFIVYTSLYPTKIDKTYLEELNINPKYFIKQDNYIMELLYKAIFIKYKAPTFYDKMILNIEDFLVTYETLKQNKTNIFLNPKQMIKPAELSKDKQQILINDLRDQLERILKQIETIIYVIPNEHTFLDSYYYFYQLLRNHLSKYYNEMMDKYNINDHTSQYQVLRTGEDKYDFIDWEK